MTVLADFHKYETFKMCFIHESADNGKTEKMPCCTCHCFRTPDFNLRPLRLDLSFDSQQIHLLLACL